jgi:hypothetical protein
MCASKWIASFLLVAIWIHPALGNGMDSCPGCDGGTGSSDYTGESGISITFTSTGTMGPGSPYSIYQPYSSYQPYSGLQQYPSCPSRPYEHLIPDPAYFPECVYMCQNGYKFDEHGNCVRASEVTSTAPVSGDTLVAEGTNGSQDLKTGGSITLSPEDNVELKAKCNEFVSLVKANMGGDRDLVDAVASMAWARAGHPTQSYILSELSGMPEYKRFMQAVVDVMKCVYTCGKLYSGEYGTKLVTQSASRTPLLLGSSASQGQSEQAQIDQAQIGLRLKEGPFLAEVVNDKVALDIETDAVTVASLGKNTFGVIHDPTNRTSIVVAYQDPVTVKPKSYALAPFTLNGGQMVMVDSEAVSPLVSFISTPDNVVQSGANATTQAKSSGQVADSLAKLKQIKDMLDAGLITQEDYNTKKNEILSQI